MRKLAKIEYQTAAIKPLPVTDTSALDRLATLARHTKKEMDRLLYGSIQQSCESRLVSFREQNAQPSRNRVVLWLADS